MRKAILVLCILYALARIGLHFALFFGVMSSGSDWQGEDLAINLEAAGRLLARENLYVTGPMPALEVYHYSPLYALALAPLSRLPFPVTAILHSILTIAAYVALYRLWRRIFAHWKMERASAMLQGLLPLWLIYGAFYGDLSFLNIYTILSLLASLLIYAVIEERLWLAVLAASLLLQAKPQWAFALALPLLLGQWRFFARLIGWTLAVYLAAIGGVALLFGPSYALAQYRDYYTFLLGMTANFPWRGPELSLGYNHSLLQIAYHWFGIKPIVYRATLALKLALLLPLAWALVRSSGVSRIIHRNGADAPTTNRERALELAFALHLGAFIWLDVLWEITLAITLYVYLMAYLRSRAARILISIPFVVYALQDVYQVATYAIVGEEIMEGYFWLDPATHTPIIMITLLALYAALWFLLYRPGGKIAEPAK